MESQRKKRIFTAAAAAIAAAGVLYLFRKPLFPFLLAVCVSLLLEKPVAFLHKKTGIPRGLIGTVLILGSVGAVGALLCFLAGRAAEELAEFAAALPEILNGWSGRVTAFVSRLPVGDAFEKNVLQDAVGTVVTGILSAVSETIPGKIGGMIGAFPDFILSVAVFFVSCFYLTAEMPKIRTGIGKRMPETWLAPTRLIFHDGVGAVLRYLRALLILMGLTFAGLAVGFFVLGVSYPLVAAFLIALVDLLPVLGVGTVLIPWAGLLLLTGETYTGVGMLILFGAVTVVRQFLEPKIVGASLGLHPLVTLLAVWSGWKLFGVGGMILFPLAVFTAWGIWKKRSKVSGEDS